MEVIMKKGREPSTGSKSSQPEVPPRRLFCHRCNLELIPMEAQFSYLQRSFRQKALRCPECGQIFIPESLAEGRMKEVETALEEK
jgi:uncharacterized protein with PIN domain